MSPSLPCNEYESLAVLPPVGTIRAAATTKLVLSLVSWVFDPAYRSGGIAREAMGTSSTLLVQFIRVWIDGD